MKMIYKILIGVGILAALGGLGWWGYKRLSQKVVVAEVATCDLSVSDGGGGGAEGQTCVPAGVGGVNYAHWTTCASGYYGVNGVGCLESTGTFNDRCGDYPGTYWACVGEGGDKACRCCPNGTALDPGGTYTVQTCPTDNIALGNVCGSDPRLSTGITETWCGSGEDDRGRYQDYYYSIHTCQGYKCGASVATPAPTISCSSITRTPTTTPSVGGVVTFTCLGSTEPAGSTSLTYEFRYSLNSGAWQTLVNKTATTADLTIASCGSYSVMCRACGVIDGATVCDPTWTAATQ